MHLETNQQIIKLTNSFLKKINTNIKPVLKITNNLSKKTIEIQLMTTKSKNLDIQYTLDKNYPTKTTKQHYQKPFQINKNTKITTTLFKKLERVDPMLTHNFNKTIHPNKTFPPNNKQHPLLPIEIINLQTTNNNTYHPLITQPNKLTYTNQNYH